MNNSKLFSLSIVLFSQFVLGQQREPIIDVHVHAMQINSNFANEMCPWFLSNMPGGDPQLPPPSFMRQDCVASLQPATSTTDFQEQLIQKINDLNVYIVASGDAGVLHDWHKAAPDRIIPSLGISNASDLSVEAFKDSLSGGFYKVMGEVAPQYQGMFPSDMSLF